MAWTALDRRTPVADEATGPVLSEAIRRKIRSFLPRYETRRAALLPALHVVQDALGHVSHQAMREIAEVLEIQPAQVLDTISFYTHFWTHEKGRKVIVLCRSLSCQLMGADDVKAAIESRLGIQEHGTTDDGQYSFVTEECLAACDHAPCLLVNERLHRCVGPDDVTKLLADANNDRTGLPRSDLYDAPRGADDDPPEAGVGRTSDVREMKES